MATTYHSDIQKLYVAYFNRPADPGGLDYWEEIVEAANGDTTAVSAAFAASAEYDATYDGKTNEEIIDQIYQNLFGRAAEPTGKAYWAEQITLGGFTIDEAVKIIGDAALTTDKTAYENKVKAAVLFTDALDTPAEVAGYQGPEALALARGFLAGITTNASYATAVSPTNLNKVVSDVVHAGTPFGLASALAALDNANQAVTDFLAAADGDDDATTTLTEADIATGVTTAAGDVAAEVPGYAAAPTAGQKAAILADQIEANLAALGLAERDYTAAVTAADKVAGLSTAVTALEVATDAETEALKVEADATVAANAALLAYNGFNATALTIDPDGVVTGVIRLNDDGELVLAQGVTEAKNKGVTALLNSIIAREDAEAAADAAEATKADAQLTVEVLDMEAGSKQALIDIGAAIDLTARLEPNAVPTVAQILDERAALENALAAATPGSPEATAAQNALTAFNTLITTYTGSNNTLLSQEVMDTAQAVEDAQGHIDDLTTAIEALNEAQALQTELNGLKEAITFAQETFTLNDYKQPVPLGATASATSGSDIYLTNDVAVSKIINFGTAGEDVLYVGAGYKLNATGDLTKGVNTDLEVFFTKSGTTGTNVIVETSAFGSSTTGTGKEYLTITLTGVTPDELKFDNGIITHV